MVKRNGEGSRGRGNGDEKELGGWARQGRKEEQRKMRRGTWMASMGQRLATHGRIASKLVS